MREDKAGGSGGDGGDRIVLSNLYMTPASLQHHARYTNQAADQYG